MLLLLIDRAWASEPNVRPASPSMDALFIACAQDCCPRAGAAPQATVVGLACFVRHLNLPSRFRDQAKGGFGSSLTGLQPAFVEDVAEAVARALQVPETHAITYECGGLASTLTRNFSEPLHTKPALNPCCRYLWKADGVELIEPFIEAVFNKLPEKSRCVLFQRILTIVYLAQDGEQLPTPPE
jgi:hypothetical protein